MNEKRDKTLTFHAPDLTTRQELPVAGSTVRAGFPSPADDFLDAPLDLNRELVHNPASTYVDGEFTVKRVRLEKGCAWLMPSNPKYRPLRVDAGNEFLIWGVVRHVIKSFK